MKLFRHRANAGQRASQDDTRLRQALREITPFPEDPETEEHEHEAEFEEAEFEEAGFEDAGFEVAGFAADPLPEAAPEEDDLTNWPSPDEETDYYRPRLRRSAGLHFPEEESDPMAEPELPPRRRAAGRPYLASTEFGAEPSTRPVTRIIPPAEEPASMEDMATRPRAEAAPVPADNPFSAPGADGPGNRADADPEAAFEMPAPTTGRRGRPADRVKTRLLGFEHQGGAEADPFEMAAGAPSPARTCFPVGWLAVIDGPGRGASFTLQAGVSAIGRGEDQAVRLDFGDNSISRSNHALLAYDGEQRKFFLGHGGKRNIVRLNDRPVLSTEEIANNDQIRIGETTLHFIALCGEDFDWAGESSSS